MAYSLTDTSYTRYSSWILTIWTQNKTVNHCHQSWTLYFFSICDRIWQNGKRNRALEETTDLVQQTSRSSSVRRRDGAVSWCMYTFAWHSHFVAFLQSTELAAVATERRYVAVLIGCTSVRHTLRDAATKETLQPTNDNHAPHAHTNMTSIRAKQRALGLLPTLLSRRSLPQSRTAIYQYLIVHAADATLRKTELVFRCQRRRQHASHDAPLETPHSTFDLLTYRQALFLHFNVCSFDRTAFLKLLHFQQKASEAKIQNCVYRAITSEILSLFYEAIVII